MKSSTDEKSFFDFSKLILADKIAAGLLGQASLEGLLSTNNEALSLEASDRRSRKKQEALSLLVLFDKLVIPEIRGGYFEVPSLESEGVLEIRHEDSKLLVDFTPIDWYRNRDPSVFTKWLEKTIEIRPLVLNYVAHRRLGLVVELAKATGLSQKKILNDIIDFSYHHYIGDEDALQKNFLMRYLPNDFITSIRRNLTSQPEREGLDGWDVVLFGALNAVDLIEHYRKMSIMERVGVATAEFSESNSLWRKLPSTQETIEKLIHDFDLIRVALHKEAIYFPRIDGIDHAMRLRRNSNLTAFRQQLLYFQRALMNGDGMDLAHLRAEVRRASRYLEKISTSRRRFRWLTYASLPISIIETLATGLPLVSGGISVFSAVFSFHESREFEKHKWVLFGQ